MKALTIIQLKRLTSLRMNRVNYDSKPRIKLSLACNLQLTELLFKTPWKSFTLQADLQACSHACRCSHGDTVDQYAARGLLEARQPIVPRPRPSLADAS